MKTGQLSTVVRFGRCGFNPPPESGTGGSFLWRLDEQIVLQAKLFTVGLDFVDTLSVCGKREEIEVATIKKRALSAVVE